MNTRKIVGAVMFAVFSTLVTVAVATGDEGSKLPPGLAPPTFHERGAPARVSVPGPPSPPAVVTAGVVPTFELGTPSTGVRRSAPPPVASGGASAPVACCVQSGSGDTAGTEPTSPERRPEHASAGRTDEERPGVRSSDERPARGARQE